MNIEISIFWIIVIVGITSLLILGSLVYFVYTMQKKRIHLDDVLKDFCFGFKGRGEPYDPNLILNLVEEYLGRRNEFWTLYGQFILAIFVVTCITILLLTKIIDSDAGLPILSGIGGFAIGKGINMGRGPRALKKSEIRG